MPPFLRTVAAVLLMLLAAPHRAAAIDKVPLGSEGSSIRVLTFNVWGHNEDYDDFSAYVREVQPDVVLLQEADADWLRRTELKLYPFSRLNGRLLVASRFKFAPLEGAADPIRRITATSFMRVAIELPVDDTQRVAAIYNFHPTSPRMKNGPARRSRDYGALQEALSAENPARPVLVAGDFNAIPGEDVMLELKSSSGLTLADAGTLSTPTRFPREYGMPDWIGFPIDHIAVRGFDTVRRIVGPDLGSDHLPVVADLHLE